MSTALQPYTNYRDAGAEWLGEIPAHWHIPSIGSVSQLVQTGPFGSQLHASDYVENGVPVINPSHLRDGRIIPAASVAVSDETADRLARHQLRTGDVIAARRGELGRCAVVASSENGWLCGTGSLIIRPRFDLIVPAFLQLVLSSQGVSDALGFASVGSTMNNLSAGLVARQRIPVPSVAEQKAIVRFLHHAQRQITRLIRNKRRLIALLDEEKQAIIQQAVTRGLDPDVAMKPSGVEWLGEIPTHWSVTRNGALFDLSKRPGVPTLPILEVSLHTGVTVRDLNDPKRKQMMSDLAQYQTACAGDLAYNMMRMWQGAVGVVPVDGLMSPAYVVVTPRPGTDTRYFAYLYRTRPYMRGVNGYSRGIVMDRNRLYWADYKQMPVVAPPYAEQVTIIEWLSKQLHAIDSVVERTNHEIDLIREYRTRLIADVVTGQLDVREAAASLPDIEEEEDGAGLGVGEAVEEDEESGEDEFDAGEDADAAD